MSPAYDTDLKDHPWPFLAKATLEMSYDNGGVNRDRSEQDVLDDLQTVLSDEPPNFLQLVDTWIKTLTDAQVEVLVAGEATEAERMLLDLKAPEGTGELLDRIFIGAA